MIKSSDYPINEEIFNDLNKLTLEYDILNSIEILENNAENKIILKDSEDKVCRFCKKSYPTVKFRNISHTIPEFIGNKTLFSDFECDNCNHFFSKFENEFANYLLPYNTFSETRTKKNKIPKYKNKIEIFTGDDNVINVKNISEKSIIDKKTIIFPVDVPSYIPEFIYRLLIKIGISIIPENIIQNYSKTIDWLLNLNADTSVAPKMLFTLFPFSNPTNKIRIIILKSKTNSRRNIPNNILALSYKNFTFQTFFPIFPEKEMSSFFPFPHIIPTPLDLNKDLIIERQYVLLDLSKKEKEKNEKIEFTIKSLD